MKKEAFKRHKVLLILSAVAIFILTTMVVINLLSIPSGVDINKIDSIDHKINNIKKPTHETKDSIKDTTGTDYHSR